MRNKTSIVHSVLSWSVLAIGCLDLVLTLATSQAREGALVRLILDLQVSSEAPGYFAAISRCNAGLASFSGYHFGVGFALLLVGALLVATRPSGSTPET